MNTLNDNAKVCVPNKIEDLNWSVLVGMNKSKSWTKHILCECKCKFDVGKCNSNQK